MQPINHPGQFPNTPLLQYAQNKGFAEDLTEGKFSFPVVHGVRANPSNRQVLSESSPSTTD